MRWAAALCALCAWPLAAQGQEGPRLQLEGELFGGLEASHGEVEDFSQFFLSRAEAGSWARWGDDLGVELRLEAIRSAGPQSVLGVDGDSLVTRVKRAWGFGRLTTGPVTWEARAGLIPDPWVDALQQRYELRDLSPTLSEGGAFFDTSDLGAAAQGSLWDGAALLQVAATNGEGRNQREQNAGKNTTILLAGRPLELTLGGRPAALQLQAAWRDGSQGLGAARDHRLALGAIWSSAWAHAGVEWLRAEGYLGRGEQVAQGVGLWANGPLGLPWLGAALRYDHLNLNQDLSGATTQITTGGFYVDLVEVRLFPAPQRFRAYLAFQDERYGANAGAVPGVPAANNLQRALLLLSISDTWQSQP